MCATGISWGMDNFRRAAVFCSAVLFASTLAAQVKTGQSAFENAVDEKPGNRIHITLADVPAPHPDETVANGPQLVPRNGAIPIAKPGYRVELYAEGGFKIPRLIRTAPNGDLFLADSGAGSVIVLRGVGANGRAAQREVFATGLNKPFGINFWPADNPQYVYVANTDSVVRFPYKNGDLKATGAAETVVSGIPAGGGHWTRDVVFSKDGQRMFVSVGSGSNVDDPDTHPAEKNRADVLEYKPDGTFVKVYAYGIRNCVGEAIQPETGELWCSVNERDLLGNHLVPDYITHVQEGGFYGWPWWYMGGTQDPRHAGKHPELQAKVITPDVLMQPHNGSLQMTFYEGKNVPGVVKGDIFAAEHGSWNRKERAGYEVARIPVKNGKALGEYEDFLTGFTTPDGKVWGRPVGITVAKDSAIIVVEDGANTVWRVTWVGKQN